jgi:flagellar biosynthesis/type III secretory pathway chaperone
MLRNVPSATLKELVRLSERKESLMAQIQEIDRQMLRVQKKFGIPQLEGEQTAPADISTGSSRRKRTRR